jgi:hypothetical protein
MVSIAHGGVPTGEIMFTTVKVRGIDIKIPSWLPDGRAGYSAILKELPISSSHENLVRDSGDDEEE